HAVLVELRRALAVQRDAPVDFTLGRLRRERARVDVVDGELQVPDRLLLQRHGRLGLDAAAAAVEAQIELRGLAVALQVGLAVDCGSQYLAFRKQLTCVVGEDRQIADGERARIPRNVPGAVRDQTALAEL